MNVVSAFKQTAIYRQLKEKLARADRLAKVCVIESEGFAQCVPCLRFAKERKQIDHEFGCPLPE